MISIVIPAYNEQDTISAVIEGCFMKYPKAEVIVVDDASTDNTPRILKRLAKKRKGLRIVRNVANGGHAYSVIVGLRFATGKYIIYMDADNQIWLDDFKLKPYDFDMISGYRVDRHDKRFRKVVSFILKMVILVRHGILVRDANCPMKVFTRETLDYLLKRIPIRSIVPSISMEILARKANLKVIEMPFIHHPYIKERKGSLQSINRKSLSMFYQAFKEVWTL